MRFQVAVAGEAPASASELLRPYGSAEEGFQADAGFSAVGTPSVTLDVVEYREGHYIYTRKQPGIPTMDDITMSRGVTKTDTGFFRWMKATIEGNGEYRVDLNVHHMPRDNALPEEVVPGTGTSEFLNKDATGRQYQIFDAFPTTHKVAGDLDATASEISVMELGVSYERFDIIDAELL
jgi:phage tail-like protein